MRRVGRVALTSALVLLAPSTALAVAAGDGEIIYGEGSVTTPRNRDYTAVTSLFGSETSLNAAVATIRHTIIKASPTRDELIMGTQSTTGAIYIQRWNGTSWSSEWNVAGASGNLPTFDIAYEQSSGDALVVYSGNVATTNELRYQTFDGTSWAGPSNLDTVRTAGTVQGVALQAAPGATDKIGLAWGDNARDLSANFWSGSSWEGEPGAALETTLATIAAATSLTSWSFDLAFESTSGDLMVGWGSGTTTTGPRWVIRPDATGVWGGVNTNSGFFEQGDDVDLDSDPNSDYIAYANNSADSGADADAGIWNGGSWINKTNFDTAVDTTGAGTSSNAVGWVTSGGQTRAIVTYDDTNEAGVDYVVFNKNTPGWGSVTQFTTAPAPANGDDKVHRIREDPFDDSRLILLVVDSASDLFVKKITFDGTTVTFAGVEGGSALETGISSITGFSADFAHNRYIPPAGSLTVDIVDAAGSPVTSPSLAMSSAASAFSCDTSTGTLGVSAQKMRVNNTTASAPWNLSIAATAGATATWSAGTPKYDFNDPAGSPAGCAAGGDGDTYAGQLSIDPSGGTITPQGGCTSTGVSLGASSAFDQGVVNSITLGSASASASTNCYWDFTSTALSQRIPEQQPAGSYTVNLTITVVAT